MVKHWMAPAQHFPECHVVPPTGPNAYRCMLVLLAMGLLKACVLNPAKEWEPNSPYPEYPLPGMRPLSIANIETTATTSTRRGLLLSTHVSVFPGCGSAKLALRPATNLKKPMSFPSRSSCEKASHR